MSQQKPAIEYPCPWGYKVIGQDEESVRRAVEESLALCAGEDVDLAVEFGGVKTSGGGKYISLSLTVQVADEGERNLVFRTLADHPDIKLVL